MRVLLISDIHGYYKEFMDLLSYVNYDTEKDYIISLGDMIDRGPDGFLVIEWFRKMNRATKGKVQSIFGNHEHLFLSYNSGHIPKEDYFKAINGGKATIESYRNYNKFSKLHTSFLASMPLNIELDGVILTHAKYDINKPINGQKAYDVLWDYNGEFYTNDERTDKIFVFGHTPTFYVNKEINTRNDVKNYKDLYEMWRDGNKICIDCTYHKERKLCIFDITNDIEHYYDFKTKEYYRR
jgi:serine/threonine protein phosphatase 1